MRCLRDYETIFIVEPSADEAQLEEIRSKARTVIESGGGEVQNVRTSDLRRLAYRVKKRSEGRYVVINMRCESPVTRELDRILKADERVLRHMTLVMPTAEATMAAPAEAEPAHTETSEE